MPSRVRSTDKDNDLTSALKSEFFFGSAFPNRGYTPGFANIPFASRAANVGSRPWVTSNTSNWARAQTPLLSSLQCAFLFRSPLSPFADQVVSILWPLLEHLLDGLAYQLLILVAVVAQRILTNPSPH